VHDPLEAGGEPELHGVGVVRGHRARRQRLYRRAHTFELAERDANLIDDMRTVGTEPTPPSDSCSHHDGTSARGSASDGICSNEHRQPRRADRTLRNRTRQVRLTGGKTEFGTEQMHHPARSAAFAMVRASAALAANGFSHTTCLPAAIASSAIDGVSVGRRRDRHDVDAGKRQCTRQRVGGIRDIEHTRSRGAFSSLRPTSARTSTQPRATLADE